MKLQDLSKWGHSGDSEGDYYSHSHGVLSGIRRFELRRQTEEAEKTLRALQLVITLLAIAAAGTLWAVLQILSQR